MEHEPIILPPGAGRAYDVGPLRGVFKADGAETGDRYCVSEWTLPPGRTGPGPHHHDANEELFLVTRGRCGSGSARHGGRRRPARSCASRRA